jgi:hypothetical protein
MARRAGNADIRLHGGRVPKWLGDRMTRLGAVITEAIVHEYGRSTAACRRLKNRATLRRPGSRQRWAVPTEHGSSAEDYTVTADRFRRARSRRLATRRGSAAAARLPAS